LQSEILQACTGLGFLWALVSSDVSSYTPIISNNRLYSKLTFPERDVVVDTIEMQEALADLFVSTTKE